MTQKRTYKRKILNFSVNRAMQLRMIGKMACILFVSLLISSAVYYHYADKEVTSSFMLFHVKARNFLDFLLPVVGISFVLSLIVGTIASLFFPKQYAGPLYRIEQDVKLITDGDLTLRINLRAGDEGGPLAGQINQLVTLFRETIISVQDSLREAQEICAAETDKPQGELQAIHARISQKISKLKVSQEG